MANLARRRYQTFRGPAVELASPGPDHILIALRTGDRWQFNPGESVVLGGGEVIIAMATPDGRKALEVQFA